MREPATNSHEKEPNSGRAFDLAWISAATLIVYAVLCRHPYLGSYPRYVLSAREMAEGGDWIVPHLAGVPYFEKPILTYWISAACQLLFGTSGFAIHLTSGIAAWISVACVYELGRDLRGRRFGLFAASMLLASAQFMVMSTILTTDPLLASWLTLSWLAYWKIRCERGARWTWIFWSALGLAWLTKGPLALVLTALSIGGYTLIQGGARGVFRELARLKTLRGLLLLVLINAPWHVLVWMRDPRFLEMFYVRINWRGLFDKNINHPGPPWYYLPQILVALLPWAIPGAIALGLSVWANFWKPLRARGRAIFSAPTREARDDERLYLACVLVFPLLFLSASSSKLGTYLLPLVPSIILLASDRFWSAIDARPKWLAWSSVAQALIFVIAVLGAVLLRTKFDALRELDDAGWTLAVRGLSLFVGGLVVFALNVWRGRIIGGLAFAGVASFAALALLLPNADTIAPNNYGEGLARIVAAHAQPNDAIVVTDDCVQDYTITLALRRRAAVVDHARELGMGHFTEVTPIDRALPDDPYQVSGANLPENTWLYTWPRVAEEWKSAKRVWLFGRLDDDQARDVAAKLKKLGLDYFVIGTAKGTQLLSNRPL